MRRSATTRFALTASITLCACAGQPPKGTAPPPKSSPEPASKSELAAKRARVDAWGDAFTQHLFGANAKKVFAAFTPQMQKALPLEKLEAFLKGLSAQLGKEVEVLRKEHTVLPGVGIYRRVVRFAKSKSPFEISFTFAASPSQPIIAGFHVRPPRKAAPSARLDYRTKSQMQLPFKGEWLVAWGGRTLAQNYHARAVDQRFALDLYVVEKGKTHSGAGKRNEDYYCFGRPLMAAAAGRVVAADNLRPDRLPGVMKSDNPLGNHLIIDQGNGEFAFYCHLKAGSLRVKAGDVVKAGAPLGQCGNSGHTSEPHLHFHLQDTPVPFKGRGVPAQFSSYRADGKPVPRGEPTQGQRVAPQ